MSAADPLVSIVTPSFNQGRFIEQTLRSIRAQRYPRVEHIVVDGGSTDGTLDVLRRYEGTYDLRWLSEPDDGMYQAVNKGLRLARGEVLAYLNTDDRYFPWTVETAVRALTDRPAAGFVFGDLIRVTDEAAPGVPLLSPPFRRREVLRFWCLYQPTVFWRRAVYETCGGFDESMQASADCEYWMRIGARWPGHKIDEILALEIVHPAIKRQTLRPLMLAETAAARARHRPPPRSRDHLLHLFDRARRPFEYRWHRLRFLAAAARRHLPTAPHPDGAWAEILSDRGGIQVSIPRGLLGFLPRIGGRFARRMVGPPASIGPSWQGLISREEGGHRGVHDS